MAGGARKEMQLVDPLYEPVIMYPSEYPIHDPTQEVYDESRWKKFEKEGDNGHYQKQVREGWKVKMEGNAPEIIKDLVDFKKHVEGELRLKVSSKYFGGYKEYRDTIIDIKSKRFTDRCMACGKPYKSDYSQGLNSTTALKELYDLYNELVNTFEMQRLMHLQMTGFLSLKYPSSTHTRFAHVVGTWIGGLIALQHVIVVVEDGEEKRLIEFLADEDMHREFMAALILHDIGHAPFSHVLEMNPHLKYDHEEVTKELIEGTDSYLELEDLLVSSHLDLEYKYGEIYGVIDGILEKDVPEIRTKEKFVLVHDVIKNMGLDEKIIVQLCSDEYSKDPAVRTLKELVHGVIDIDRIDHIYRDLHYNSFKTVTIPLTSLFHGMKIHYGDALEDGKKPWVAISEEITPIIETLLEARELSNKAIFDSPVNNFYIGVLNSAISDAVIMMPLLKYYIPYLTDESLLHVLTKKNLFHNLSPTEKASIITASSFKHMDYKYSTYTIRERENGKMPGKELEEKIKGYISKAAEEEEGVVWYAFLKEVRRSYKIEAERYMEPEVEIEKLNEDEGGFEWLSILLEKEYEKMPGKKLEREEHLKDIINNSKDEKIKEIFQNSTNGHDFFKKLYEGAKDGKDLEEKIKKLIGKKVSSIFFKGLSTNVYIGSEPKTQNRLENKLRKCIEGITWDGDEKRSWTFTLFAKKEELIGKVKDEIQDRLNKNGVDIEISKKPVKEGMVR